ncbi:MAG: hypothetical protein ACE5JL_06730 [Dehalococcoidia bacterium]
MGQFPALDELIASHQTNQTNHFVDDDINLRDTWRVLARRRFLILERMIDLANQSVLYFAKRPCEAHQVEK